MNKPPIHIGAVIPTFNRVNSVRTILTCLQQQSFGPPVTAIVVVDGSTDGTIEMLTSEFPTAILVHGDGNWWYTRSINEGIKRARQLNCNFILTLNDDLTFSPDYIKTIIADQQAAG